MNPEQFQQMMQTVAELSGDAKEFGIWYLIAHVVTSVLAPLAIGTAFMLVIYCSGRVIARIMGVGSDGRIIGQALGIECGFGEWGGQHRREALSRIDELKTENREMREVLEDRQNMIDAMKRQLEAHRCQD